MDTVIKKAGSLVSTIVCDGASKVISFPSELETLKQTINRIDINDSLIDYDDPPNADFLNQLEIDRDLLRDCEKIKWYSLISRYRKCKKLISANKVLGNSWNDTINRQNGRRMVFLSKQMEETGKQIMVERFLDGKDHQPLYSSPIWERRGRPKELLDPVVNLPDPDSMISGKSKRKEKFTLPSLEARATIIKEKSRKMDVGSDVNFEELAKLMEGFGIGQVFYACEKAKNQAQSRNATQVMLEDFQGAISLVNHQINEP